MLNEVGKRPSLKERLASCEISWAKTPGQALMREEGMKSAEEHLAGEQLMILYTSALVTGVTVT